MSDLGSWIFLLGRVIFALYFVAIAGPLHVLKRQMMTGYARQVGFPLVGLSGVAAGVWLLTGGLSIALGVYGDVGALMIALFVVIAAAGFHRFWEIEDEMQKMNQMQLFWRNVTMLGGAAVLFAVFSTVGHGLGLTLTDPLFDLR